MIQKKIRGIILLGLVFTSSLGVFIVEAAKPEKNLTKDNQSKRSASTRVKSQGNVKSKTIEDTTLEPSSLNGGENTTPVEEALPETSDDTPIQNQEQTDPVSETHPQAGTVYTLYSDDAAFWSINSGGVGNIDIQKWEDIQVTANSPSSLAYQVTEGTRAWVNIQHGYLVPQDWLDYDSISFYWYGKGTGSTFTLNIEASTYGDRFTESFIDDFTGWKKIVFEYNSFNTVGSPSWQSVKKILFVKGGNPVNTWYIDSLQLEASTQTFLNSTNNPSVEILRWSSSGGYENPYDGYAISQETDVYMAWTWHKAATEDIQANSKEIICYFNLAGRTKTSEGYIPSWLLLDQNDNDIWEKNFPQNFIVDPLNEDYRAYVSSWVQKRVDEGFTGIFWDNGFAPYAPSEYYWSTHAVNPRTGLPYTNEEWVRDTVDLLNYLKAKFPDMLMISNGGWSGSFYYKHYDGFQYFYDNAQIEGIFSEGVFSNVQGYYWPAYQQELSMRMIQDQQEKWLSKPGKSIVSHTYTSNSGRYDQPGVGVIGEPQAAKYVYCLTLMGVSAETGNMFSIGDLMSDPEIQRLLSLDLGASTSLYRKVGFNTYIKEFKNATVLVNTGTVSENVNVGGIEYTMQPMSGELITN